MCEGAERMRLEFLQVTAAVGRTASHDEAQLSDARPSRPPISATPVLLTQGLHKDGFLVNFHLVVTEMARDDLDSAQRGQAGRHFYGRITLKSSTDPEEGCAEVVIDEDGVVESAGESLDPNFDVDVDRLQGTWADELLTWPDGALGWWWRRRWHGGGSRSVLCIKLHVCGLLMLGDDMSPW